jgi:polysaccharide export outer membrane protein
MSFKFLTLPVIVLLGVGVGFSQTVSEPAINTSRVQKSGLPSAQKAPTGAEPSNMQPTSPELRIGGGDVLDVKVYTGYAGADVAQNVRVDNVGNISLPLVGTIPVAGLTAQEAEASIEQKYKDGKYFKNPHVTVFLAEYSSQGVSVFGEVAKPGVYPLVSTRTLLDVLSATGGLTPAAGNTVTITRRQPPQEPIKVELTADGSPKENVPISPGDSIVVERSGIVYVVGDVTKPGGFPVNNRTTLTVLQALALAEGTKPNAALNDSKLIRKTEGNLSGTPIPLKQIIAGKSPDLPLQAGDIVFVPTSLAKGAARRSLEAIVQVATGVVIYRR